MIMKNIYRYCLPHKLILRLDYIRGLRNPFISEMDKKKLIFIHVPKAAGTSIANEVFNKQQPGHFLWSDYRDINRKKYESYFKFSFVRNPYDRLVSAFFYLKKGGGNKYDLEFSMKYKFDSIDFSDFIHLLNKNKKVKKWVHFVPQSDFLIHDGVIVTDFLGKFESIDEDMKKLRELIGLEEKDNARKDNKSIRNGYETYYNKELKDIVYSIYKEDFVNFEYER